jgi:hypothetical protein
MAKGDKKRAEQDYSGLKSNLDLANDQFTQNYQTGVAKNLQSYDDIMSSYKGFLPGGGGRSSSAARGTFSDLAGGGFSPQQIQDLRARAIAPTRSIYASARNEVDRNRALGGGFSPNHNAALAKMAREQSYNISDINTNANASIAEMQNRNRLAGASGLAGLDAQDDQLSLATMNAMGNLYGTTPGLASTFGNQLLSSEDNLLRNQSLRQGMSDIPSNFSQGMGNASQIMGLTSKGVSSLAGLGGKAKTAATIGKLAGIGGGSAAGLAGTSIPMAATLPSAMTAGSTGIGSAAAGAGGVGGIGLAGAATLGIGAVVAAAVYAWQKNRNSTKNAREDFSKQLGYKNTDQLYNALDNLGPEGKALKQQALNVIGKKDSTANKDWMTKAGQLIGSKNQSQHPITGGFNPTPSFGRG